ncbi:MAG: cupredoxin domain-containing protein [Anaerolineales bacterium]
MSKRISVLVVLLAVLGVLLAACGTPTLKITLIAQDIHWNLTTINAKVGQPIEITLRNEGALDHNLVIEEFDIDELVAPGAQAVVTLTFDEAGTYAYICSIPGHEEAGMVGEIIVR